MTSKHMTAFGQAALTLDQEFMELERLAEKLERLSLQTEQGPRRAAEVIQEAVASHNRLVKGMMQMATCLEEVRLKSEKAMTVVAEKANALQQHQKEAERLSVRFQALGEMVREVSSSVAQINTNPSQFSPEEQEAFARILTEFNEKMNILVQEACQLQEDARAANIKIIESSADSLRQSLELARRRLNLYGRTQSGSPNQFH